MRAASVFIIWVVLSGLAQGLIWHREHFFVDLQKTWTAAQDYCKQHYHDLSTITNDEENIILTIAQKPGRSWIGLHQNADVSQDWYWSDGDEASYRNWNPGEPDNNGEHCAVLKKSPGSWFNVACNREYTFFCYKRKMVLVPEKMFVLVPEMMFWEEALLHCRKEHADLASLLTDHEAAEADAMANETHTPLVWTSLHFLADEWLWVSESNQTNQEFTQGSLPSCPAKNHRCGARRPSDGQWENRDCQEKLNFFCYKA